MTLATVPREFSEIPLALIDEPARPSRSAIDEDYIESLAGDIRLKGLIQPICVGRDGDRFQVIAGHCRLLACRRAGFVAVTCFVYPSLDVKLEGVKYSENKHRKDLSAADEALYFAEILETDAAGDVDKVCDIVGEKRSLVEGRLLLFQGDVKVFEALQRGDITIGVAQQLNRCDEEQHRRMLLDMAVRGGATVALVSGWIAEWVQVHKPANRNVETAAASSPSGPVAETNYFRCVLCGKTDNVHQMQPRNFHTFCEQAMFADMLAMWRRQHEYVKYPRTADEATALIVELGERFPIADEPEDPRRI